MTPGFGPEWSFAAGRHRYPGPPLALGFGRRIGQLVRWLADAFGVPARPPDRHLALARAIAVLPGPRSQTREWRSVQAVRVGSSWWCVLQDTSATYLVEVDARRITIHLTAAAPSSGVRRRHAGRAVGRAFRCPGSHSYPL
ncbi:hypothetical protein [Luedemannella helvata]|uniref:Uncharacterized protein n=1 Tax=Luedemannella helvata TaxID=349315 RepID=A0ABP4WW19_9ACTN